MSSKNTDFKAVLTETVQRIIRQHRLIVHANPLVVAASGGADSLVLCHLLHHAGYTLHIATLDHGLRGDAGRDDALYMCEIARRWDIPCIMGQVDVPKMTGDTGIEATARRARYDFLASVAHQVGATTIATAHHADDQAETVLMHILRGSGLRGLRGMAFRAPVPGHADLMLVRPLLTITRSEIDAYCQACDLVPREDATNRDTRYLRNYIRHEALPILKNVNPDLAKSLVRLADSAAIDDEFIREQYALQVMPHLQHETGRLYLARAVFVALHPALQRRFLLDGASQFTQSEVGYKHVIAAVAVALNGEIGGVAQLPGGVQLRVDYRTLVIEPADLPPDSGDYLTVPENTYIEVNMDGETAIPGVPWRLSATDKPQEGAHHLVISTDAPLVLRTRRPGDRLAGRSRKLKTWMIDHKIPREIRPLIPLLEINGNIVAILLNKPQNFVMFKSAQTENKYEVYFSIKFS